MTSNIFRKWPHMTSCDLIFSMFRLWPQFDLDGKPYFQFRDFDLKWPLIVTHIKIRANQLFFPANYSTLLRLPFPQKPRIHKKVTAVFKSDPRFSKFLEIYFYFYNRASEISKEIGTSADKEIQYLDKNWAYYFENSHFYPR